MKLRAITGDRFQVVGVYKDFIDAMIERGLCADDRDTLTGYDCRVRRTSCIGSNVDDDEGNWTVDVGLPILLDLPIDGVIQETKAQL